MTAILLFICKIILCFLLGRGISLFSLFFDMIIQPGMIGHFYINRLARYFSQKYNKEFELIERGQDKQIRFEEHFNFCIQNILIFKPLGGCMQCANVWHSIVISALVLLFIFPFMEWYWVFVIIFESSFYLRYLMNKI